MNTASNNDIARAIYLASKDNTPVGKIVEFLARKHFLGRISAILSQLGKVIRAENGTVLANVKSAKTLPVGERKELEHFLIKRYAAKEVILEDNIDSKLLGGFKIEVDDEVIDLTIKNKIGKLQEYLTSNHE